MKESRLIVKRPLDRKDQFTIAEMQAKTARAVGTHIGSPIHLLGIETLGADILPRFRVGKKLARMSKRQSIDFDILAAKLTDKAPESASNRLEDVRIACATIFGKGALRMVGLGLDHPTLDAEAVSMNLALDQVAGISPPIWRYQYMNIALVGEEHAADVKDALSAWLHETMPTIDLEPLQLGTVQPRFAVAS